MVDENIQQWCNENNWTEPRKLISGVWVAFPPGGVMETPLPWQPVENTRSADFLDLVHGLILMLGAVIVGAIAIVMSPLYLAGRIRNHKKSHSVR